MTEEDWGTVSEKLKGAVGDIVFVQWLDEGNGFLDINSQTQIDVSTAGLSR
jgi:hypothetical protein